MADKPKRAKFKFVEMFIDPKTGGPIEQDENNMSPKMMQTKNFGEVELHQIARIEYEEIKSIVKGAAKVGDDGQIEEGKEEEKKILVEKMGERGGWIEKVANLSQDGDCWVEGGGIICGNGYVSEDVKLSSGEVGENAKVSGKAKISGSVGIGGSAYVYGEAEISGSQRIAVKGSARVCGKVGGGAVIQDSAYVGAEGVVEGQAIVGGSAMIFGKVSGNAKVSGSAIVYGEVTGDASIESTGYVGKGGKVEGSSVVIAGYVGGSIAGKTELLSGQPYIGPNGKVESEGAITDNAWIDGSVSDKVSLRENATILNGGSVSGNAQVDGGAIISGQIKDGEFSGAPYLGGQIDKGTITDGARVVGTSQNATIMGSANVAGTANAEVVDNAVIPEGATQGMALSGNQVFLEGTDDKPQSTPSAAVIIQPS